MRDPGPAAVAVLPPEVHGLRAALVVAHPGHELRLHGWLEAARPDVFVLTDGAGRTGRSRLDSTERVLARAGARPGRVFGRFTDPALYAALLEGRVDAFTSLARELAAALAGLDMDYVVADAAEGYNPAHDLCRYLADAAVALAGGRIASFEFPLVGPPDRGLSTLAGRVRLDLDDEALARKMAAARGYAGLDGEVSAALEKGTESFRTEALDPSAPPAFAEPPWYERHGAEQVARGFYTRVLRWSEHVRPIAEALAELVAS